jgi:hypothetical protein
MEPEPSSGDGGGGGGGSGAPGAALRVPPLEAAAVEFPGYIRNPANALAALGGEAEASSALGGAAGMLRLWLRPGDPLSHPLFGERRRARSLLLRVARRRAPPPGADSDPATGDDTSEPTVSVAAVVTSAYRFTGLADFQYLPVDPRAPSRSFATLPERNRPDAAEVFKRPQPFLLVPPLFSRSDVPADFPFADEAPPGAFGAGTVGGAGGAAGGAVAAAAAVTAVQAGLLRSVPSDPSATPTVAPPQRPRRTPTRRRGSGSSAFTTQTRRSHCRRRPRRARAPPRARPQRRAPAGAARCGTRSRRGCRRGRCGRRPRSWRAWARRRAARQQARTRRMRRRRRRQRARRSGRRMLQRCWRRSSTNSRRVGEPGALRRRGIARRRSSWQHAPQAVSHARPPSHRAPSSAPAGPWKQQLIRCGYDPRTDRAARQYQSVTYRCPSEWWAETGEAGGSPPKGGRQRAGLPVP